MAVDDAARRIIDQFGETSQVPLLNLEEGDVGVLIAFPIAGLLGASLTGIDVLTFPFVLASLVCAIVIVAVAPSHLTAWTWLNHVLRYLKRPRVTLSAPAEDVATGTLESNTGGLANYTPFEIDERTQDLTNVERAWPGAGAIERTDDTMEAFLEIEPGNMDFAMSDDWAQLQEAGADFANTELDATLKFHATTRSFPVEQVTATIKDRLDDEDVSQNPILQELLAEYRELRPAEMHEQGVHQMRYYLGVQVTPLEIYNRYDDEQTPIENLTDLPVIGVLFTPFVTRRDDLTESERRQHAFKRLDERITDVRTEFVQPISGWSARRLSTVELFSLTMDFWNGREHDSNHVEQALREQPIMDHRRREENDG